MLSLSKLIFLFLVAPTSEAVSEEVAVSSAGVMLEKMALTSAGGVIPEEARGSAGGVVE